MDFNGQGRFTAYKVDRPLTEQERTDRLDRTRKLHTQVREELSFLKINSTYMELVDRWYAPKGWLAIFAIMMVLPFAYPAIASLLIAAERTEIASGVETQPVFSNPSRTWRWPRRLTSAPASIDTVAAFRPWRDFRSSVARGRRGHHGDVHRALRPAPDAACLPGTRILAGDRVCA